MSEYNTYAPLNERLVKFQAEIHALYSNAVNDRLAELQDKAHKETTERLYGPHSALTQFEMIEELKDLAGENIPAIVKKGAARGFTEDESLVIYNMARYTRAYENMKQQKEETIKLLLAEATKV